MLSSGSLRSLLLLLLPVFAAVRFERPPPPPVPFFVVDVDGVFFEVETCCDFILLIYFPVNMCILRFVRFLLLKVNSFAKELKIHNTGLVFKTDIIHEVRVWKYSNTDIKYTSHLTLKENVWVVMKYIGVR